MIRFPGNKNKTPSMLPTPLSKSRDYNSIELLFNIIFNYYYVLSSEIKNCHNPKRCNVDLLPLLAQYYRYQYTDVESIALEREIIPMVSHLHHWKGTATGIDNALALCKVNKTEDAIIPWFYTAETNTITVISYDKIKTYKMKELLSLVVPLGTKITIKPGYFVQASEEVKMHSWTEINCGLLDPDKQYYVQKNNYWHTTWDPDKQLYHIYVDAQWALGDPTNPTPHAQYDKGDDGAARVGGTEVASNDTTVPNNNLKGE